MKKIFGIASIMLGMVAMTGCDDFLDQNSPSEQNTETVYNSTYYTGYVINKIYGGLTQDATYSQYIPIVWSTNSDIELVDGRGASSTTAASERSYMNYINVTAGGWSKITTLWTAMYGVIENCNLAIDGIRKSDLYANGTKEQRTAMGQYLGEALTLRAMLYLDLIRFFGDIPMKMEPTTSDNVSEALSKTDRDEILDYLLNDLAEAADLLPWAGRNGYTTEHATRGYAKALYAQVALLRGGWNIRETSKAGYETASYSDGTYPTQRDQNYLEFYKKALVQLSDIIQNGPHKLNPSFENHWQLVNARELDVNYYEDIFQIPMLMNTSGELGYTIGTRYNGAGNVFGYGNSSAKQQTTAMHFYSYKPGDLRRDISCQPYQWSSGKQTFANNQPLQLYIGKWDQKWMNEEWQAVNAVASSKVMTGVDCVRMRYSQVLLMYAEVLNELAGPDASYEGWAGLTAREALAQVHNRAFATAQNDYIASIPSSKEGFFNAIVDENAWELVGEGVRKFDLERWNLLVAKIKEAKQTYYDAIGLVSYDTKEDGSATNIEQNNKWPTKFYFNYTDDTKTVIDWKSVNWYTLTEGKSAADFHCTDSVNGWGKFTIEQYITNMPTISAGLVENPQVINRYLLPISTSTLSDANNTISNSYGY